MLETAGRFHLTQFHRAQIGEQVLMDGGCEHGVGFALKDEGELGPDPDLAWLGQIGGDRLHHENTGLRVRRSVLFPGVFGNGCFGRGGGGFLGAARSALQIAAGEPCSPRGKRRHDQQHRQLNDE